MEKGKALAFFVGIAEIGDKHHRKLQTFALVDGKNLNGQIVGFQPELVFLLFGDLLDLAGKPVGKTVCIKMMCPFRLMQDLPTVQDIGQLPFAAGKGKNARTHRHLRHEVCSHDRNSLGLPDLAPDTESSHPAFLLSHIVEELVTFLPIEAEHWQSQDLPHPGRFKETFEQSQQIARLNRVENACGTVDDCRNAALAQKRLNIHGLFVGPGDDGDVLGGKPCGASVCLAQPGLFQQSADGGRHGGIAVFCPVQPERQGLFDGMPIDFQIFCGTVGCRFDALKTDLLEKKGIFLLGKQMVDAFDQGGDRAPVCVERKAAPRFSCGFHIGEDVAAAKAVDSLFGIADDEQQGTVVLG